MRERAELILKIVCLGLGVLLAVQLAKLAIHANPLAHVTIPDLPTLPAETNSAATAANRPSAKPDTNNISHTKDLKTNVALASSDTNAVPPSKPKEPETNNSASSLVSAASTSPATNTPTTNTIALVSTNNTSTNAIALTSTNISGTTNKIEASTNVVAAADTANTNTASASIKKPSIKRGDLPPGMLAGLPGGKSPKLPPGVQARVDRITESEILGPVVHPMPMALLGIAGNVAFLRSPSGQTGLVKEGEDLGEIKLLRIGVNRVLIEQNGEKKELMIFAGLGGESLLPKPTQSSDETTNRK